MAGYDKYNFQNNNSFYAMNAGNTNSNRVYINPNFNQSSSINRRAMVPNNGIMHVNPNFSQIAQNCDKTNAISKTKIYINPNFIRTNHTHDNNKSQTLLTVKTDNNIIVNDIENLAGFRPPPPPQDQAACSTALLVNKSRYSFVRPIENKLKEASVSERVTKTVKISKYKSVPLSDLKKDILSLKSSNNIVSKNTLLNQTGTLSLINNKNRTYSSLTMYENRFKLIKHQPSLSKNVTGMKNLTDSKLSVLINKRKKLIHRMKLKIAKRSLKKNNIPCPLFKKFGKCMRDMHGNCELLHDKKHVSICRKFLKGICHDKECLLSHDLTAKKMPTCYFYLKGMCTKEDCPYLHVKLNEKTKICTDFLKGYCEKGNKCLNRHTNVGRDKILNKLSTNPQAYKLGNKSNNKTKIISNNQVHEHKGNNIEHRYYQDQEEAESSTNGICEVIKPSRCKLGSLPSFIQL